MRILLHSSSHEYDPTITYILNPSTNPNGAPATSFGLLARCEVRIQGQGSHSCKGYLLPPGHCSCAVVAQHAKLCFTVGFGQLADHGQYAGE